LLNLFSLHCSYFIASNRHLPSIRPTSRALSQWFVSLFEDSDDMNCPRVSDNSTMMYSPSVGLYNRCTRSHGRQHCGPFSLHGLATDSEVFPGWWKAALVLLCIGLSIMAATVLTSVLSCCVQSIFRKSIFTVSGAAQTIAGTQSGYLYSRF
jgi:hypothetical protein